MTKTAETLISEQVNWAQDRMFHVAIKHISESFDSFPSLGFGMKFVKRSAENLLVIRIENDILPDLEDYIALQLEYVNALVEADNPENVHATYQSKLMQQDPFLVMVDTDPDTAAEIQDESRARGRAAVEMVASWIKEAEGQEFEDFYDMITYLDKTPEDVDRETTSLLFYVDMMDEYREHLDASVYSHILSYNRVHSWFIDQLIEGLNSGRQAVIDEIQQKLAEQQER